MRISDWSSDVCSSDLRSLWPRGTGLRRQGRPSRLDDRDRPALAEESADRGRRGRAVGGRRLRLCGRGPTAAILGRDLRRSSRFLGPNRPPASLCPSGGSDALMRMPHIFAPGRFTLRPHHVALWTDAVAGDANEAARIGGVLPSIALLLCFNGAEIGGAYVRTTVTN